MRDIAEGLRGLLDTGAPFAVATVISAQGSSPRPAGAAMAVSAAGEALGSISGGCVEGAVYDTAERVLGGEGAVVETYGYSDDDAFAVGLTCGGTLQVLVAPADRELLSAWTEKVAIDEPVANQIRVTPDDVVVIVEGNYLLLDEAPWGELADLLNATAYMDLPDDVRIERLVARHVAFGRDRPEALEFVRRSDESNARRIEPGRKHAAVLVSSSEAPSPNLRR